MLLFYLPFANYRRLEKLTCLNFFGLLFTLLAFFGIIMSSFSIILDKNSIKKPINPISWTEAPRFFGVILFTYDINGIITEIGASM